MKASGAPPPNQLTPCFNPAETGMLNVHFVYGDTYISRRAPAPESQFSGQWSNAMDQGSEWNPELNTQSKSQPNEAERDEETLRDGAILLIEDNPGDVLLVREALREHGVTAPLFVITDGEKAVEFIESLGKDGDRPCPALVLLDLNLPKRTGHDVLSRMREMKRCEHTPVVILSSSDAPADRRAAAAFDISRYIRKPSTLDEFMMIGGVIRQLLGREAGPS
jgi:two-component system, chemotaxis family, response regulator Rcp1